MLQQISDSLRHFGLSDKTKHLLLVKISPEPEDTVSASMRSLVHGQIVPLSQLGTEAVNFSAKALRKVSVSVLGRRTRSLNSISLVYYSFTNSTRI